MAEIYKKGKDQKTGESPTKPGRKPSKPKTAGVPASSGSSRQGNVGHEGNTDNDNVHRWGNKTKTIDFMARTNVRRGDRGAGADLTNEQRAVDDAINERLKSENERNKLDPRMANNKTRVEHKSDLSQKKTGRSKH